jgi:hypothetical protein
MKGEELDQMSNCHLPKHGCPHCENGICNLPTAGVVFAVYSSCCMFRKGRPAERAYLSFELRTPFELEEYSLLNSHIQNVKYNLHNAKAGYCGLL